MTAGRHVNGRERDAMTAVWIVLGVVIGACGALVLLGAVMAAGREDRDRDRGRRLARVIELDPRGRAPEDDDADAAPPARSHRFRRDARSTEAVSDEPEPAAPRPPGGL